MGSQYWVSPFVLGSGIQPTFLVREFERDRVRHEGRVERLHTYFDRADAIASWARSLVDLRLGSARIGLELDNTNLTYVDVTTLSSLLPGVTIVDVSRLVPAIMATKSEEELEAMRMASEYTDRALEAFADRVTAGVSEAELEHVMRHAAEAAGSVGLRGSVALGRRAGLPHVGGGDTVAEVGDVAVTEISGYRYGYCAAACRTAVIGSNPGVERLYTVARVALERGIAAMRPGVAAGHVYDVVRATVVDAGFGATMRHRAGYANGLQANGRLNISLAPGENDVLDEGMTFHLPILLFMPGEYSVACSQSVVVTSDGTEVLGSFRSS
ncbi:Xaa-Pro peptidase family protein [Microbacterium sp.]|uniref:M24 family metallopeptidase n=1 Tax=Microbacterium sp. TaxID=51671 RepID=UPI002601C037|nr:Xaa-Pro peptidase family protein [Microbacterium sp.]